MVPEFCALGFLTTGHMHVTVSVFWVFFLHHYIQERETFHEVFLSLSYTSSSCFNVMTIMVLELHALGFFTKGHMHVTVFHHQKRGP
jgi:hypothetical protein